MSASKQAQDIARMRERQAWELRAQFKTQAEIATIIGVDQTAVSKMLRRVNQQAQAQLAQEAASAKMMQVSQLEYIALEAMRAWERSKQASKATRIRTRTMGTSKTRKLTDSAVETEMREGDTRYLQAAMKALSDIRDILGLNAPVKFDIALAILDRFITVARQTGIDPNDAMVQFSEALIAEHSSYIEDSGEE